jgi:glycosyltransferase involved in cell wall biosynthesis
MKIVHIITSFGIGGAEKLLLNVINEQVKTDTVYLFYLKPIDDLINLLDKRVNVTNIPLSIFTIFKLNRQFKKLKPEIIHTHLSHADILGGIASSTTKAKLFCTMHNIYFKKNWIDTLLFKVYRTLFLLKKINVICISKCVYGHVVSKLKQKKEHSFLLNNAIPPIKLQGIKRSNPNTINLLFVGRLEKQKSISTLLQALHLLQNQSLNKKLKLTIVGDGSYKKRLKELTIGLKIQNVVKFVGSHQETQMFYTASDIFILPSIWEGFGIVILEAFRAKLPVIASDIEGPAELIQHNHNGVLFEKQNHHQLAARISDLIDNEKKRIALGENGHETFKEKYHIRSYVSRLRKLYISD